MGNEELAGRGCGENGGRISAGEGEQKGALQGKGGGGGGREEEKSWVDAVELGLGGEIGDVDGGGGGGGKTASSEEGEKGGEHVGISIDEGRRGGEDGGRAGGG